MSQQHMQFEHNYSEEPDAYSGGYTAEPPRAQSYTSGSYGQKLTMPNLDMGITAGQRLALAIVSLAFFVFIVLLFAGLGFTRIASDTGDFIGTGFGILVLYSIVAIFINVVFNRRR